MWARPAAQQGPPGFLSGETESAGGAGRTHGRCRWAQGAPWGRDPQPPQGPVEGWSGAWGRREWGWEPGVASDRAATLGGGGAECRLSRATVPGTPPRQTARRPGSARAVGVAPPPASAVEVHALTHCPRAGKVAARAQSPAGNRRPCIASPVGHGGRNSVREPRTLPAQTHQPADRRGVALSTRARGRPPPWFRGFRPPVLTPSPHFLLTRQGGRFLARRAGAHGAELTAPARVEQASGRREGPGGRARRAGGLLVCTRGPSGLPSDPGLPLVSEGGGKPAAPTSRSRGGAPSPQPGPAAASQTPSHRPPPRAVGPGHLGGPQWP